MEQSKCYQVFVFTWLLLLLLLLPFHSQQYKVEAGQLEVKQNLVKFNNFVREKQGKVDRKEKYKNTRIQINV